MYIILHNIQKNRTLDLNVKIITIQLKKSKKELHYNVNEIFQLLCYLLIYLNQNSVHIPCVQYKLVYYHMCTTLKLFSKTNF